MNRLDRLSAILIQLQSKKMVRGQDIADRFGISLRTAYRDIKSLEAAGVPILSEAGHGYSLMEGYRLPPVMFSREEALTFLTAEKLIEKFTDQATFQTYQSALYKIKAVLRSDEKEHLASMDDHIALVENPYLPKDKKTTVFLQDILKSISQGFVLSLDYRGNFKDESTKRDVEAIGIFLMDNFWYLLAYCRLRKDYRTFRLDRILCMRFTDEVFTKKHPSLKQYLKDFTTRKKQVFEVVIRIDKSIEKYLGDQKYYNGFVSQSSIGTQIELRFLSSSLEGFARWYLMYGDYAEILSPPALKTRVKEISSLTQKKLNK